MKKTRTTPAPTARTRRLWEHYALVYDRALLGLPLYVELVERIAVLLDGHFPEARAILDAGCGTGNLTTRLARSGKSFVTGLDATQEMLTRAADKCRKENPAVSSWALVRGDLTRPLPFRSGVFDAVVCVHVLYALPDVHRVLEEFRRVLRPGGGLITCDMSCRLSGGAVIVPLLRRYGLIQGGMIVLRNLRAAYWNWRIAQSQRRGIMHHWSENEFCELLNPAGFEILHQERGYIGDIDVITAARRR